MEETMEILSINSAGIEQDLESLIFSMLNLIDTKTKTLKKLIKLHLQIKSLRNSRNFNYKKQQKTHEFIPSSNCPVLEDSVDDLTFSEESQRKLHRSEQDTMTKPLSKPFFISKDSNIQVYERETTFQNEPEAESKPPSSVTEFVTTILENTIKNTVDTTDDEEDRNVNIVETTKIDNGLTGDAEFSSNIYELKDSATTTSLPKPEQLPQDEPIESDQAERNTEENDSKLATGGAPPMCESRIESEPNRTNKYLHSTVSSSSSFCIISNIQGVLKNLHECLPGDSGVYIEKSSYKDIVKILERVLISCGICYPTKEELGCAKVIGMNKSSTQPTLKATYEEVPKRMISSTTECNKLCKKKTRI